MEAMESVLSCSAKSACGYRWARRRPNGRGTGGRHCNSADIDARAE